MDTSTNMLNVEISRTTGSVRDLFGDGLSSKDISRTTGSVRDLSGDGLSSKDIDVCGYVHAERMANTPLEDIYGEQIANAQEAIRLAKKIAPNINCKLEIMNYIENDTLVCVRVRDMATGFTGIPNLQSKEMFKLFHHPSKEQNGFSEYGIGGKLKNMLLAQTITYKTKTNTGPLEMAIWDVPTSIEKNSIFDSIEYSQENVDFVLADGYYTGTELVCENITDTYRTAEIANSIVGGCDTDENNRIYDRLCKKYIRIDDAYSIDYIVYKDGELVANKPIVPTSDLANYREKTVLHVYESMSTKRLRVLYERSVNNNVYRTTSIPANGIADFTQEQPGEWYEIESPNNARDVFRKDASLLKPVKIASIHANYIFRSKIIIYCSTDECNINSRMGFDTYRTVEGGFICKTNHDKIRLKWSKWNSHRTRYAAFRGAIVYDRNSDVYLNSDKTKAISDDRPFHDLIRWNILHITDKYFAKMKVENGFYETDVQKRRELKMAGPPVPVPVPGAISGDNSRILPLVPSFDVILKPLLSCDDKQSPDNVHETEESLIEILCALHGKPGDILLATTFRELGCSHGILQRVVENLRLRGCGNRG